MAAEPGAGGPDVEEAGGVPAQDDFEWGRRSNHWSQLVLIFLAHGAQVEWPAASLVFLVFVNAAPEVPAHPGLSHAALGNESS